MSLIIKFSQNIFKNNSKTKRNFIIYHFLAESKPHERIDLLLIDLQQAWLFTRQKKVFQL